MTKSASAFPLILMVAGLAGCSLFPSRAPEILTDHDFGPLHAHAVLADAPPVIVRAKSLPWLSGTTIHYRLLYKDPTALHIYAQNRWVAPPAALLKARVRWRLGAMPAFGAQPPRHIDRLVIVLSRFDQDFTAPHHAFVRLTASARLYDVATGQVLARQTVNLRQPCAPDAQGAVTGLSELARQASAAFVRLATHSGGVKDPGP